MVVAGEEEKRSRLMPDHEVLRAIEKGARHEAAGLGAEPNPYLALLARIMPPPPEEKVASPASPIIIP